MVWDVPIALYLFLAGMGAGVNAAVALSGRGPIGRKFRLIARVVALVTVCVGLVLLMLDAQGGLRHPLRLLYLLSNFGSVMTWGVVFLVLFCVVVFAEIAIEFLQREVPRVLDYASVVVSVCVATYTGVLLGVSEAYPLWNLAVLPLLFVVSAAGAGIAAANLVALATKATSALSAGVEKAHELLPFAELALIAILLIVTGMSSWQAGPDSVNMLTRGSLAVPFWIGLVGIGLVLPAVMGRMGEKGAGLIVAENACTLFGGLMLRLLVLFAAVPVALPAMGI